MAGLASMLLLVVIPELRKGNSQVKRAAIVSLMVWYLIDSAGSIAAGVLSNVFLHDVFNRPAHHPAYRPGLKPQ